MKNKYMKKIRKKLNTILRIAKEKLYVLMYPADVNVNIFGYDPESKKIAEDIFSKINDVFPELKIYFIGSASMGIAGCKDIDIFVESMPFNFDKFIKTFNEFFGQPVCVKKDYIEWKVFKGDWSVDILLINPKCEKFKYQVGIEFVLQENKSLLEEYDKLKWKMDGMPKRKYQYEKNKFFNKALKNVDIEKIKLSDYKPLISEKEQIKRKMLSVTIGIPAYNEAYNIGYILDYLQKQVENNFSIREIIVISDGSTDETEKIVQQMAERNRKIRLIADGKRLGKFKRINQLFEKTLSDIVVVLDADIKLKDENVISYLLEPLVNDEKIMHSSGYALPLEPITIVEKIVYAGIFLWEYARMMPEASDLYLSEGRIRAFRRSVYKKMIFPNYSADEAFSFLFCEKCKYKFAWVRRALVFYQMPKDFSDYLMQMRRFLKSKNIQQNSFNQEFLDKYYNIKIWQKVKALWFAVRKDFTWTVFYVFSSLLARILLIFDSKKNDGIWNIAFSTKKLNVFSNNCQKKTIIFSNYDDLKNPWYAGGGALAIHEVAKRMSSYFEVRVITGKYPSCKNEVIDGIYYKRIGISFCGPKIGQLIYSFLLLFYLRKEKFDVWFESFTPPFTVGLLPIFTKKPVVGLTHMLSGEDMFRKYKIPFHYFERWGFRFYDKFVVLSEELKKQIGKYNKKAYIEVIPNGVDLQIKKNDFSIRNNIIFLGRIEIDQKGLDLLLDACYRINASLNYQLYIAGSGNKNEEDKLIRMIEKMNLSNNIRFIGRIDGAEKQDFFRKANFLVMPSRFDTFSIVVLEAFSYGLPVVTFNLENLKWIPESCAIKVDPFNQKAFTLAIEKMIVDQVLRKEMGERAFKLSKDFSWDNIGKKYLNFVNNIL